jgi:iron transport multicopper oxidase
VLVAIALLVAALALPAHAFGGEVTNSGDNLRDGWYPEQSTLNPSLVSGGTFGQLWSASVEGSVYAQPLLADGTLLVATENDKVYGLDPTTGAQRWTPLNLGTPWHAADIGCGDLAPNIGVTATPVIDTSTNTAYMTHKTYVSGTSGPARWYMDAIDITKGTEKAGFPVLLSGAAQNAPGQTFQPTTELQRPGLLLLNGVVYAAFGSDCDISPWQGWVFGVSEAGGVTARWTSRSSGNGAGIWQSGAGITSDGSGTLLVSTGNGGAPSTPVAGNTPPANLGESIVRLAVQSDGSLKAVDFFAPFDAQSLDTGDVDFASGGITGLNEQFFGTPSTPKLAVAVGKDGYVYLLNREELGGFMQGTGGGDKVVQRLGPSGGVWSRPGVWPGDGGWVYIPTASAGNSAGGSSGFLRVYQYGVSGSGQPTLSLQATSSDAFGFGTGAPVITSEGTTSGSALVWTEWMPNGTGAGAQLRAYDPIPVSGKPVLRYSAPIGTGSKFATPGVGANRLYVGNREGKVMAFGSPITAPMSGPTTSFPTVTIGSSSEKTLTLTANESLTVTKVTSSSSQFIAGAPTPALPAPLTATHTIVIPLTFKPTQTGLIGATLSVETSAGTLQFALSGTGRSEAAQLEASPTVLSFVGT